MFEFVIGLAAFFIVFGVLAKFALPKIQQTLEERADAIEGGIKRAEEAQAEAHRTLEQYQEQMAAARAEVAEIRQQAEAERAGVMEEARKAAEAQAAQIAANATAQIEAEKAKALSELRKSMGGVATDLAGRIVGESMTDDARAAGCGRPVHRRARAAEPERRAELMIGASRTSMAALREAVNARFDSTDAAALAADGQSVLSLAALLGHEPTLRQTLADPAMAAGAKQGLSHRLLDGKVSTGAFDLVVEIVTQALVRPTATWPTRWTAPARAWC